MKKGKLIKRLVLLALVIFIVFNLINFYSAPDSTVVAQLGTMEKSYSLDGIIARDEYPIESDFGGKGILDPIVSENEMVKKGKLVAIYYESNVDDDIKARLAGINEKIADITSSPSEMGGASVDDTIKINSEIETKINSVSEYTADRSMDKVAEIKNEINALIQKRNGTDKTSGPDTLEKLKNEKSEIEKSFSGEKEEITSPSHGIFSTSIDGLEGIITPDKLMSLTVSDYDTIKNKIADSKKKSKAVCKIIDNSTWWISAIVDEDTAEDFSVGNIVQVSFNESENALDATVEYISSSQGGKYMITLSSTAYSPTPVQNRFAGFTLIKSSFSGLKVPVKAIRVKDGKTGVYVRTENTVNYREIEILYKDDKYAIVKIDNTKSNALLLYDEIIVDSDDIE